MKIIVFDKSKSALSKNIVIYHRGERRVHRVLRLFQSLLVFSDAFAFSVCSALKFKDLAISLENSTVPSEALSKNIVIYHRGERRVRRVLGLFQSLFRFSGAFAFSVCSALKFKDLAISLENSTVPSE